MTQCLSSGSPAASGYGSFGCGGCIPDTVNGAKFVRDLYELANDTGGTWAVRFWGFDPLVLWSGLVLRGPGIGVGKGLDAPHLVKCAPITTAVPAASVGTDCVCHRTRPPPITMLCCRQVLGASAVGHHKKVHTRLTPWRTPIPMLCRRQVLRAGAVGQEGEDHCQQ